MSESAEQPAFRLDPELELDQPFPQARDEVNFATRPLALVDRRAPKGVSSVTYESNAVVDGKPVTRKWTITAGEGGLPVSSDVPVMLAILQLAHENDYASPRLQFSLYSMCQRLGLEPTGANNKRVLDSIRRLTRTTYTAVESWYDAELGEVVREAGFHAIESYDVSRDRKRSTLPSEIVLGDKLFRQIAAGGTKQIDMLALRRVRTAVGQSLYRFLDRVRLDGKPSYEIGLMRLAHEHIGLSKNYYPSDVKRQLDGAHTELLAMGFLRSANYRKGKDGDVVTYVFGEGAGKYAELIDRLVASGVTRSKARRLMAVPAAEIDGRYKLVEEQLDELDALRAEGKRVASPGGWLKAAIEGRYDHSRSREKRVARRLKRTEVHPRLMLDEPEPGNAQPTPEEAEAFVGSEVERLRKEAEDHLLATSATYKALREKSSESAERRLRAELEKRVVGLAVELGWTAE